jgi:hypothetical protein
MLSFKRNSLKPNNDFNSISKWYVKFYDEGVNASFSIEYVFIESFGSYPVYLFYLVLFLGQNSAKSNHLTTSPAPYAVESI